jgi:hypothetical protein
MYVLGVKLGSVGGWRQYKSERHADVERNRWMCKEVPYLVNV